MGHIHTHILTHPSYLIKHTCIHTVKKTISFKRQTNATLTQTEVLKYHKSYVVKEQRLASPCLPSLRHSTRDLPSVTLHTKYHYQTRLPTLPSKTHSECNSITATILRVLRRRHAMVLCCCGPTWWSAISSTSHRHLLGVEGFAARSQPLLRVPL